MADRTAIPASKTVLVVMLASEKGELYVSNGNACFGDPGAGPFQVDDAFWAPTQGAEWRCLGLIFGSLEPLVQWVCRMKRIDVDPEGSGNDAVADSGSEESASDVDGGVRGT